MKLESTGLRKILILVFCLAPASLVLLSCGSTPSGGGTQTSGIKYRAFLTNNVAAGTATPGIFIVNAQNDTRGPSNPISAGTTPGMMVVSPNLAQTIVFSGNGTPDYFPIDDDHPLRPTTPSIVPAGRLKLT